MGHAPWSARPPPQPLVKHQANSCFVFSSTSVLCQVRWRQPLELRRGVPQLCSERRRAEDSSRWPQRYSRLTSWRQGAQAGHRDCCLYQLTETKWISPDQQGIALHGQARLHLQVKQEEKERSLQPQHGSAAGLAMGLSLEGLPASPPPGCLGSLQTGTGGIQLLFSSPRQSRAPLG